MDFKKYPKIRRLGVSETEGILEGTCYIQEKIDGANTSIWKDEAGLRKASRNQEITTGFNGFIDYVDQHEGINAFLNDNPGHRMYGEWLVPHTLQYSETSYKNFYLFDIENENEERLLIDEVNNIAYQYGIKAPTLFAKLQDPELEDIEKYVGRSDLGEKGEGVVIKNPNFINKYGDRVYAKLVTQEFIEGNALTFGGNNKYSDTYIEMYFANSYVTIPRIEKVINKLTPLVGEPLSEKHTARVINTVYHDIITEEAWEIAKKCKKRKLSFHELGRLCTRKAARMYLDILANHISVAYKQQS